MAACTISDLSFIVSSPLSSELSIPNVDRVQLARHPVSAALTSTSFTRTGSTYKIPMVRSNSASLIFTRPFVATHHLGRPSCCNDCLLASSVLNDDCL